MNEQKLRELDMWIGVNVFGKKAISRDGPRPAKGNEEDYFVIEFIHISCSLPRYTTDPSSALLVLEKCAGKVTVTIERAADGGLMVAKLVDGKEVFCKCSKSLPLAICRFAKEIFQ